MTYRVSIPLRIVRAITTAITTAAALVLTAPLSANPNHVIVLQPSELIQRGNSLIQAGELDEAKVFLKRALTSGLTERQTANAHNSLCVAFIKEEHWRKAMNHCDAAIELVGYNWRFFNNRGNIYLGLGQPELALREYSQGLKISPNAGTLLSNMRLAENQLASSSSYHKSIKSADDQSPNDGGSSHNTGTTDRRNDSHN